MQNLRFLKFIKAPRSGKRKKRKVICSKANPTNRA